MRERWTQIQEFPNYEISELGDVRNYNTGRRIATSVNNHGHVKVALVGPHGRCTRGVGCLVAQAFVPQQDPSFTSVIFLNGQQQDLTYSNLAWRTPSFAWRYVRQQREAPRLHYTNLNVLNLNTGFVHINIIEAAEDSGLLYSDIWRSTYTGNPCYPTGEIFAIA